MSLKEIFFICCSSLRYKLPPNIVKSILKDRVNRTYGRLLPTCYYVTILYLYVLFVKTSIFILVHLQSSWHKSKLNEGSISLLYPCPFCDAHFESGNELKDHIESEHHSQVNKLCLISL